MEFAVDEMGFVREPKVIDSKPEGDIGWSLQAAAVAAAEGFRYAPRFVDGKPVAVDGVRNRIVFEIAY